MKDLRGKRALVTGAASGIGRAIALELADRGVDLFLVDIDPEGLQAVVRTAGQPGNHVVGRRCDLAVPSQITETTRAVGDTWGGLDILVNNAGIACYGPTELMSRQQWDRVLAVNLLAPIQLIRELLPTLLDQPEAHILNVASIAGLVAGPRLAAYHASKFGLVGLSESLRAELGPRGVGVTALCPGLVNTSIFDAAMSSRPDRPLRRPPAWACARPEAVARRAVRAICRNRGLVVVTPMAHLLWTIKRLFPGLLDCCQRFRRRRRSKAVRSAPEERPDSPGRAAA